ncbi:LysR family transcriptional regulator [Paraburkholderia sediminicola]|jgi:Transcriptional regulator|nr:LysR family transcriptional regulator [Paraburkholderia sediminicola]
MALTRVTVRQFETFLAIAEYHSLAGAAERLGLTPSAVSQLLAEFESELGFRLFDRTTRRLSLSSAGKDFLPSAESWVRHLRSAEQTARDIRERAVGVIRVGAPLVLASTALPAAIAEYAAIAPKVVVRLCDTPVQKLVESVADSDVDFAIGPDHPIGSRVERQSVFESPWAVWCAPTNPLAKRRRIRLEDLRTVMMVQGGRDDKWDLERMISGLPEDSPIVPFDVFDNATTAFGMAAQGTVVTMAPGYVLPLARMYGLVMKRMAKPETLREVCIYAPKYRTLSPAALGFRKFLTHWLPKWNANLR